MDFYDFEIIPKDDKKRRLQSQHARVPSPPRGYVPFTITGQINVLSPFSVSSGHMERPTHEIGRGIHLGRGSSGDFGGFDMPPPTRNPPVARITSLSIASKKKKYHPDIGVRSSPNMRSKHEYSRAIPIRPTPMIHEFSDQLQGTQRHSFDDREANNSSPGLLPNPNYDTTYPHRNDTNGALTSGSELKLLDSQNGRPMTAIPVMSITPPNSSFKSALASPSRALRSESYKYKALEGMQFRLVRVLPERQTMIKCEIIHASLDDAPQYVAISYAWGDAGDTREIELEGFRIPIAVSLHGALQALRLKGEPLLVWADALCIDQQNRDERTQQVQLMTDLYSSADSVAIWLGPEVDDSASAIGLLRAVANQAISTSNISSLVQSRAGKPDLAALVSLFERDYWRRLWVVQEVFNARSITVYCGTTQVPWKVYQDASNAFRRHRDELDYYLFVGGKGLRQVTMSPNQFSYSQVLVYQGPGSFQDLRSHAGGDERSLLDVLRACRRKLASDPKDKLYGVLGVLSAETRNEFRADYSKSVKDVYTEAVDYLLKTTERFDVICEAIHFPAHTSSNSLPSYVPDWSHIPQVAAMGHRYNFSAAGTERARCRFLDERLNKLEIDAIYLDTISSTGIAVGTFCTLADYLMAFTHWLALLLETFENKPVDYCMLVQQEFCRTISLGQIPPAWEQPEKWMTICYHIFASLTLERIPNLPLIPVLQQYANAKVDIDLTEYRQFLQKHFGSMMMGRCFCITEEERLGMGSGFMLPSDVVVIPMGCSTPILLRAGARGEYRFIGDVYILGYMYGKAIDQWKAGKRELRKYVLY